MAAPWARVLNGVPGSRLVLKDHTLGDEAVGAYYLDLFARHGLAPERIHYEGKAPYTEYLDAYNRIDVALDPFRLNGGMTTVESLWMGVPVVTLAGDHCSARMGVSHLTAVGLEELIAASPDDYLAMAVALATDGPRLAELRATLRERLRAGLCDAPRFTRGLEAAYREMWRRRCAAQTTAEATAGSLCADG